MKRNSKFVDLVNKVENRNGICRIALITGVEFVEPKNNKETPKLLLKSNEIPLITIELSNHYKFEIISENNLIISLVENPKKFHPKRYIFKVETFELYKNLYTFIGYTYYSTFNKEFYNKLIQRVFFICFIERKGQDNYYIWPEVNKIKEKYNIQD